jgi:hypothetical protein
MEMSGHVTSQSFPPPPTPPTEKIYQYTLNMNPFVGQNSPVRFIEDTNLFGNVTVFHGQRARTLFAVLTDILHLLAAHLVRLNVTTAMNKV